MNLNTPGALRDPAEVERRQELWREGSHVSGLRDYVRTIERDGYMVPLFDPADAGTLARTVIVLEAPGTMADATKGSGFISVDNADQTARNCWRARNEVGLFEGVLHWNIVPWYLGVATKKPTAVQLADGAVRLRQLLDLLPNLETVVLCGEYAKEGYRSYVSRLFSGNGPDAIETWHPSPSSLNFGTRRAEFTAALRRAAVRSALP